MRLYEDKPGRVPLLEFLDQQRVSTRTQVIAAIEALRQLGHTMRPPHNEHLGDQLYYLRITAEDGTYRVFYWPFGKSVVVMGHGFSKKSNQCPPEEIKRARRYRDRFARDPDAHTYRGRVHVDQNQKDD